MGDLLVLWDLDGTLLNAGGVGGDLYGMVFESMFGRPCEKLAPMAGRTDRAIILDTLAMAGVPDPRRLVDPFIERIRSQSPLMFEAARRQGRALTGAAEAIAAVASARVREATIGFTVAPPAAGPATAGPATAGPPAARRRPAARRPAAAAGVAVSVIPAPAHPADALLGNALAGNALAGNALAGNARARIALADSAGGSSPAGRPSAGGTSPAGPTPEGPSAGTLATGLLPPTALLAPDGLARPDEFRMPGELLVPAGADAEHTGGAAGGARAGLAPALDGPLVYPAPLAAVTRPAAGDGPAPAGRPEPGTRPAAAVGPAAGIRPTARPVRVPPCGRPRPESRRVHQSVLTGNVRPLAEVKLSAVGLRHLLDLCIGAFGDDHEVRAELVHLARRRAAAVHGRPGTDFSGEATVVVGDTPLDIEAALSAGARAVGVATGGYPASTLRAAGAHAVLTDLSNTATVLAALLS